MSQISINGLAIDNPSDTEVVDAIIWANEIAKPKTIMPYISSNAVTGKIFLSQRSIGSILSNQPLKLPQVQWQHSLMLKPKQERCIFQRLADNRP